MKKEAPLEKGAGVHMRKNNLMQTDDASNFPPLILLLPDVYKLAGRAGRAGLVLNIVETMLTHLHCAIAWNCINFNASFYQLPLHFSANVVF